MSIIHLLGNGDHATRFKPSRRTPGDKLLICNMPPFAVDNVYATVMVDFKMMRAINEGSVNLDFYDWVLGTRPQKWMEMQPQFYLKHAQRIKEFYTVVPDYAENATSFNCGHVAAHYACNKLKATELHMYGFDSLFDFNMRSITDLYLKSDRGTTNNNRLIDLWRPIWNGLFDEFPDVKFVLYHKHNNAKVQFPKNVQVNTQAD